MILERSSSENRINKVQATALVNMTVFSYCHKSHHKLISGITP